jgi:acyl carrier protein
MDSLPAIKKLAAKQYGADPETIDADAPIGQLGIDSLGFLEFLFELEDHLGFPVPQQEVAAVKTLRELAGVVDRLAESATPPATP